MCGNLVSFAKHKFEKLLKIKEYFFLLKNILSWIKGIDFFLYKDSTSG